MNEPHQWVDLTKKPVGIFCYCPASVAKFQKWLQKKYGDIQTLNDAWGYFYNNFDEVRPPRWTSLYSDYIDFRLFTMDNMAEEISYRTDIIKKLDQKPVIAHAWGGGSVTCSQLGGMAFDDWKNAKIFDKWGYSAFPKNAGDCAVLGMGCDATRCAAKGKEYWQSELTAGITGSIFAQKGRIDGNTFDKFSLESIRHGAEGLLYWQYRKERIGAEFGGFAMTDYDGGPTPLTEKAGALGKMLAENGDILKEGKSKEADVALVFSMRSYLADWASNGKKNNKYAIDSLSGYYTMFWEENIPVDIIHEDYSDNLSKYKLIILPTAMAISPTFAEKLKKYIENGGTVLSEQMFGIFNPTFKLSYTVPGYGFDKIFGANQDNLITRSNVVLSNGKSQIKVEGNRFTETYKNVTANTLYKYEDESPAILFNRYGKGEAILSGINIGLAYSGRKLIGDDFQSSDSGNVSKDAKKFVLDLCDKLGVEKNICSVKDVKVSVTETETDCIIIMINSSAEDREGTVQLNKGYTELKVVYGQSDAAVKNNEVQFTLKADESAVLRLKL